MTGETVVASAAALMSVDEKFGPLILSILHHLRDRQFYRLVTNIVDMDPLDWHEVNELARRLRDKVT